MFSYMARVLSAWNRLDCAERELLMPILTNRTPVAQPSPPVDFQISEAEWQLVHKGFKIAAIKCYRNRTGRALKDAKDTVESEYRLRFGQYASAYDVPQI